MNFNFFCSKISVFAFIPCCIFLDGYAYSLYNVISIYKGKSKLKERFVVASVLRLISALLIFAFHYLLTFTGYGKTFFPLYFAVQVFLFISGFLYGDKKIKNLKEFYLKNFAKILVPVIVVLIIFTALLFVFKAFSIELPLDNSAHKGPPMNIFGHLWFVYAIIMCYGITPMLAYVCDYRMNSDTSKKAKIVQLFEIILVLLTVVNIVSVYFGGQFIIVAYLLGYYFKRFRHKITSNNRVSFLFMSSILFIVSVVGYALCMSYTTSPSLVERFFREVCCLGIGASICIFVFSFSTKNKNQTQKKTPFILRVSDKYSYTFFLVHHFLLIGGLSIFYMNLQEPFRLIIALVGSMIGAFIVQLISQPIIKLFNFKRGNKTQIEQIQTEQQKKVA